MYIGPWQEYALAGGLTSGPPSASSQASTVATFRARIHDTLRAQLDSREARRLMDLVDPILHDIPSVGRTGRSGRTTKRQRPPSYSNGDQLSFPPISPSSEVASVDIFSKAYSRRLAQRHSLPMEMSSPEIKPGVLTCSGVEVHTGRTSYSDHAFERRRLLMSRKGRETGSNPGSARGGRGGGRR